MNSCEILDKLVRFPTISSRPNDDLIAWVAEFLRGCGAEVELIPAEEKGKVCLWARLGPPSDGGVVLAGHTDVVPVEGQSWQSDPFVLKEREGKLLGRGCSDMKGFVACSLAQAEALKNKKLCRPLYIALTHDEETDMGGAQSLLSWLQKRGERPEWFWLGEPTLMCPVNSHKGVALAQTLIKGVSAHSSCPENGLNALYLASDIIRWIREEAQGFSNRPHAGSMFTPPYTTFNVGMVSGGTANNIVPGEARIMWDYRLHPHDDEKAFWSRYDGFIRDELSLKLSLFPQASIKTEIIINRAPFIAAAKNPGVDFICRQRGLDSPEAVSYGTEAPFYQALGAPVVICGPGSIDQAHKADEFVTAEQLNVCENLLQALGQTLMTA